MDGDEAGEHLTTPLTGLLGIEHPILLAPMGDTAGGRLAAEVSGAGGLGMLGGGYADPAWLERELAIADGARIGVGFVTFALDERPDALRIALEAGPVAVQLSFGDPRPYVEAIREAGALLFCGVQTPEEIDLAVEVGADVLIAQGRDAGGHGRPDRGTMALVPSVIDAVSPIPVVAAGGIADGRGLAAALVMGAAGVTLGTRFLASTAALSSPAEAAGIVAAHGADTVRTDVFDIVRGPAWPAGHDGRAARNRLTDGWRTTLDEDAAAELFAGSEPDDYDIRPLWAGEAVDLIDAIETPAEIIASVVSDAVRCIEAAHRLRSR